jgi:hypothetical protein
MQTAQRWPKEAGDVAYWTQMCRNCARGPFLKRAELGGDGKRVNFEQALSNLAHTVLQERAPQLLQHELGFQLMDKDEDNNKAVGVFGFKVGEQLIYVPVFFINGELRGQELMYLKGSDSFVPLSEEWVNYVLNRKPLSIGEEVGPNMGPLGVSTPNMDSFRWITGKRASDWLSDGVPGLGRAQAEAPRLEPQLPRLLEKSAAAAQWFLQLLDMQPKLVRTFSDCYGADMIKRALDTAKKPPARKIRKQAAPEPVKSDLSVYVYTGVRPVGVTDKVAETIKRDGFYVDDQRTETSKLYRVSTPMRLQNPDRTGIYDVLCRPDDFTRCFVATDMWGEHGRQPSAVVVRLGDSGNKAWSVAHPSEVYAVEAYNDDEYSTWVKDLQAADSLERGAEYLLVTPNGETVGIFTVENTEPAEDDEKCYRVWFRSYDCMHGRPARRPPIHQREDEESPGMVRADMISLKRIKGKHVTVLQNVIYMPEGTKKLKLKSPAYDYEQIKDDTSQPPAIRLGTPLDVQIGINKSSSALKLYSDGCEAVINDVRMPLKMAVISLVKDHGLREKAAREAVAEATRKHGATFRIKYAQPYPLQQATFAPDMQIPEPGGDPYMGSAIPTTQPYESEQQIPGLNTNYGSPPLMDPPSGQIMQSISQAAQSGQQEVLDTSVLGNMMNASRDDTMVDQYLPALVKGLDAIGRLLFNRYQHSEQFEERFGNDLSQIEDSLRNTFENLGDITLKLKQRTIQPYLDENYDVDLEPSTQSK